MRSYEGMFIIDPALSQEDNERAIAFIEEEIVKNGGEIEERDPWGRRRLAYPINKHSEGVYYRLGFKIEGKVIDNLKKTYQLNDMVMRTLITLK